MDLRKLKTLIDLVKESGISEIELTEEGDKVRIVNAPAKPAQETLPVQAVIPAQSAPAQSAAPAPVQEKAPEPPADIKGTTVTSPMVGTFFTSPSPGAKPFVQKGDHVEVGQTLCIIEAMKLLNEIEAETSGTVLQVFVENAQPVEFGQPLFLIG